MNLTQLTEEFGVEGVLSFRETSGGLLCAEITTPSATATIYLQGAHVAEWQPTGAQPVRSCPLNNDTHCRFGKSC